MTVLPRAATSPELAKLRSDNQSSRIYISFPNTPTVYTARLASVPTSNDQVTSITYNSGVGTHTDIVADQTILIGTSAGTYDLGILRLRNTTGLGATSGTMNIQECSEVSWASGAYLTVIDEIAPRARHPRQIGTTQYMDWDIAYIDQHSHCDSIPVFGNGWVLWLTGSTVSITLDGSQSWAQGNTITGYSFAAPGASATSGLTTTTPTITYNATGTYRIALTLTNSDGAVFTSYRKVMVVDDSTANGDVVISNFTGDYQSGGWSCDVTMYAGADKTSIRDGAQVFIHRRDWYGNTEGSVGYVAGEENIEMIGWVIGATIKWLPEHQSSYVTFKIAGPQFWADYRTAYPEGLRDVNASPTKWTKFFGLTARAFCWHMLHWRTTFTRCLDVFPCDNNLRAARLEAPGAQTLWSQITTVLDQSIIAKPVCDHLGRVFFQIEQNLTSTTPRAAIPSVMTLTGSDWTGEISFEPRVVKECSYVELSGVSFDGVSPTAYKSVAPGHTFANEGKPDARDRLVLNTQAETNTLCGLYYGWKNPPYRSLTVNFASNMTMIDIAPYQWVTIPITATDTPRSITDTVRAIPRTIRRDFNNGYILTSVDFEVETFQGLSQTDFIPPIIVPEVTPPVIVPPPPPIPLPQANGTEVWLWHYNASTTPSNAIIYSTDFFSALGSPTWQTVAALPADLAIIYGGSIKADGSVLYVVGLSTAGTPRREIWKTSNPKAATPTWSKTVTYNGATPGSGGGVLVTNGDVTNFDGSSNGFVALTDPITSPPTPTPGNLLASETVEATALISKGGSRRFNDGTFSIPLTLWLYYTSIVAPGKMVLGADGYHAGGRFNNPGGDLFSGLPDAWNSSAQGINLGGPYYRDFGAVGNTLVQLLSSVPMTSSIIPCRTIFTFPAGLSLRSITGPFFGTYVYVLASDGSNNCYAYYSPDGINFAAIDPANYWRRGRILSANLSGGKFLVWIVGATVYNEVGAETVTNSNEFIRYTADCSNIAANPWTSATGNMWAGTPHVITSGDLTIRASGIVYT